MPKISDIEAARERIADGIIRTPVVPLAALAARLPCPGYLKLESLQRTGSFKDRGALNCLLTLPEESRRRGVVTASAGNHAQALAYHCSRLGIRAEVVMPEHTPLVKVANTRRFGAGIRFHGATLSESMVEAHRLEQEEGLVLVHAFDDDAVMAGQGTIGLELLEQVPDLTAVVVPIGGGGLIAGIATAVKARFPQARIFGVEAFAAASAMASREAGRIVHIESADTIADGIAVKRIGERTFPILERLVDDIVAVGEQQIADSVHLLLEHQKVLAEGAGAAALAAVLGGELPLDASDRVVLVLSGGNIDPNLVERIIARGLVGDGRLARLVVTVRDRPGQIARVTAIVAAAGANVLQIAHQRAFADIAVAEVRIALNLETRGREHLDEIVTRLRADGVRVEATPRPA